MTNIINAEEIEETPIEEQIEDYPLKLFMTKEGYLKKISLVSLRSAGDQKLKENDEIIWEFETGNKAEILVFTDKCNVYKTRAYDVPDCKASLLGEYLPSLLQFTDDESPIAIVATTDFSGHVLFCYENGKMAKIPLVSYATKTNRKKLSGAYYQGAKLIKMLTLQADTQLVAISNNKKVLIFPTASINEKSTRSSQGVNVMTLKKGAKLEQVLPLDKANFKDPDYYKTKNIPAVGCFLKSEDEQVSFEL